MSKAATRLREAREAASLTQAQVAEVMGVPRPNVARWESGTQLPRVDTALRLAAIVGSRVEWLWMPVHDEEAPAALERPGA